MFVRGRTANEVELRTTFGLVRIGLEPKKLRWVCEEALGFSGTWDPPLARDASGRLWIGLEHGVRISTEGCARDATVQIGEETIGDLAETPSGVIGVTATSGRAPRVFRQVAGKAEVTLLASGPVGMKFETLEAALTKPQRIYLTGADYEKKPLAHLFRSSDGGKTIEEITPKLSQDGVLFLSAIDPKDPERIYLRQITETGGTRILVSNDGGTTLREVLSVPVPLLGLARSLDGRVLLAAAADEKTGMLRSEDRGEHWRNVSHVGAQCLFATPRGFFACANPLTRGGLAALFSRDNGTTFEPFATFADIQGPDACDAVCTAGWPKMRQRLDPNAVQAPEREDDDPPAVAPTATASVAPAPTVDAAPVSTQRTTSGHCASGASRAECWFSLLLIAAWRRKRGSALTQPGG